MKSQIKTSATFILVILFVLSCVCSLVLTIGAAWIHTFNVFTRETPVAVLKVSEQKEDELGEYVDVSVKELKGKSPIVNIFSTSKPKVEYKEELFFKLYGDTVFIGGPTIKFHNVLTLLNFETLYKVAYIRGEYSDDELEKTRTQEMFSRYQLNGGYSVWRSLQDDMQSRNIRGVLASIFIDDFPRLQTEGIFVSKREREYTLCVTEEGFLLCD